MFYATAGQQATQTPGQQQQQPRGMSMGPGFGMPGQGQGQQAGGAGAGGQRAGPPGFGARTDPGDFPALGSSMHPHAYSTSQAPQGQAQGQGQTQQQGQIYHPQMSGLAPPPPPPGIAGPTTPTNGLEQLRGEDFPALGGEKDRINYLRSQQSTSPSLPNGASHSPSTQAVAPTPANASDWARHSPISSRPNEPVIRPVQQILTSPVDKWGLKALLYEISTQMGKTDRGVLMFGEELADMGLDVGPEGPLYPTFVTPWQDPSQIQPSRIQESFHIPSHYAFHPTQMSTKTGQMTEETLMVAFYSSPQDAVQIDAAAELFTRGWRYHTEHQIWLNGPAIQQFEPSSPSSSPPPTRWLSGPFLYFDPRTFSRDRMPDDAVVNAAVLEWTMPAPVGSVGSAGGEEKSYTR